MKAAYIEKTGEPNVITFGELPDPVLHAREVLVQMMASSVNPVDTYIRAGKIAATLPMPFVPGCDVAGVVTKVGPAGSRFRVGDRVWGSNQGLLGRQGTSSELCAIHEDWLYPTPQGVPDADAAALALVGITAHLGLFQRAQLKAGETVFVNGGSGGVGLCVVQMAKAVGATVIATAGQASKVQLLKDLGADVVLNYKSDDLVAATKSATDGAGVNVFFDTVPPTDLDRTIDMMAPRGRLVLMAGRAARPVFPNGPFYVKGLALHGFVMFNMTVDEQRACANDMNTWTASGQLRAMIGRTFLLSELAHAHQFQEENTAGAGTLTGKIVVVPK